MPAWSTEQKPEWGLLINIAQRSAALGEGSITLFLTHEGHGSEGWLPMSAAGERAALRSLRYSEGGSFRLILGSELAEFLDDANPILSLWELEEMTRTWQRAKRASAYHYTPVERVEGGAQGGLKRTDEGAKNNYSNNIIKHFSKACSVAGTVLSTVCVLIHLILITTLWSYQSLSVKECIVYKAVNYPICQFPPKKMGEYYL